MKPVHLLASTIALAVALIAVPNASARPAYRQVVADQFKLGAATQIGCQYCHLRPSGGEGWNAFGTSMDKLFDGAAKHNIAQALYLTLKANKDSDGDGYTDSLEVYAKTAPGDAKSKPAKTVAVLQAAFTKAGGVDQYKPK